MSTGSKGDDMRVADEDASTEPLGLSATAYGYSPPPGPRAFIPSEHQEAVELIAQGWIHRRVGRHEQARHCFFNATQLERKAIEVVTFQPERGLIAESGARAAIQCGLFSWAVELASVGSEHASEALQWALLRVRIEADLLRFMNAIESSWQWQVPRDSGDEQDSRIMMLSPDQRRLIFEIDPDISAVHKKGSDFAELIFAIPPVPPPRELLGELRPQVLAWLHEHPVFRAPGPKEPIGAL